MERGPMALFGAIVAVGLGPAMWLGAQFGSAIETPNRPPAVTSEQNPQQQNLDNGGGAGSAPEEPAVGTKPRGNTKPLAPSSGKPSASATGTPGPSGTTTPPSDQTPPTGPTKDPGDPPTGGDSGGPPPSPPPSDASDQGIGIDLPVL